MKGHKMKKVRKQEEARAQDLDETRRLLYMALAAPRTKRYSLVGTLVNALAHHSQLASADVAMEKAIAAVEGGQAGAKWARELIAEINDDI